MELQSSKHHGNRKHGGFGTRLYRICTGMKDRCFNKNGSNYYAYGAKGIIVCDEWKNSFEAFRSWALENGNRTKSFKYKCKKCKAVLKTRKEFKKWN